MSTSDGRIRPEEIARVVVRPLGSVLPLGFLVFGVGIFVTAAYSLGWIPPKDGRDVFLLALVFVAPVEAVTASIGATKTSASRKTSRPSRGGIQPRL